MSPLLQHSRDSSHEGMCRSFMNGWFGLDQTRTGTYTALALRVGADERDRRVRDDDPSPPLPLRSSLPLTLLSPQLFPRPLQPHSISLLEADPTNSPIFPRILEIPRWLKFRGRLDVELERATEKDQNAHGYRTREPGLGAYGRGTWRDAHEVRSRWERNDGDEQIVDSLEQRETLIQ